MKKSLVIALALMLVLAFASSAMAAQALNSVPSDGTYKYLSTTATGAYPAGINASAPLTGFARVYGPTKFTADGISNYPYEIYLPNEVAPGSYRIHSSYSKNTDACASCHATHTAVGESLLQWYSAYETCMACHDGTISSTYDVVNGDYAGTGIAQGGAFGTGMEGSVSNHNVTGAMAIAAAPGGSTVAKTFDADGNALNWTVEFGCESCHTPHGLGGNARILHPDANNVATDRATAKGYATVGIAAVQDGGGKWIAGNTLTADSAQDAAYNAYYFLNTYPYSTSLKVSIAGEVYDGGYGARFTSDNSAGYTKITMTGLAALANANPSTVKIVGIPSLKVTMDIRSYLQAGETVEHVSGMNTFCGACHTDYNTATAATYNTETGTFEGSGSMNTGTFSQAHRHQVGFQWHGEVGGLKFERGQLGADPTVAGSKYGMECLTCHVAHGTNETYWATTLTAATKPWNGTGLDLKELSGSSALKRMPNMGTCEACHAKGSGNAGYAVNSSGGAVTGVLGATAAIADAAPGQTYVYSAITTDMGAVAGATLGWVGSAKCLGCHEEYVKGWSATGHATSGHNAGSLNAGSCAPCHNPGATYNYGNPIFTDNSTNDLTLNGALILDDAITCESCHGTGKNHILAPTSKNIFNPGTTDILRQTIECGRCHDMYANKPTNTTGSVAEGNILGSVYEWSGSAAVPTGVKSTSQMYAAAKAGTWSVGFRVAKDDPTKFANASQLKAASTHFGGAWGYADSKHFLGTGTAANPNGVVSCNTCHDMHSEKHAGLLKFEYSQVCSSCHDASANLAFAVAMPNNSWGRHQIELNDYAHSFKFGAPATITTATLQSVNLEKADAATGITYAVDTFEDNDTTNAATGGALFAGPANGGRGGGVGQKLSVFNGATQLFNNYAGTWSYTTTNTTATEGVDYIWEAATGAIEFPNGATNTTFNNNKLAGSYTVTWTSTAFPSVTASHTFVIQ